ncbi:MAG: hypothetical protein M3118_04970 [Actinomycetota bacterium]|nr:hypothetical protein [Actinomycetota bacterium]
MGWRLTAERLLPRTLLALLALALVGVLLALWSGPADAQTTFTVNRTGDGNDREINGVCDASRKRGKQCTLRAAIQEANDTPGADTINFNIGGTAGVKTISPASALPTITDTVTINGYTQQGASENTLAEGNDAVLKIQLNGANAGTVSGLAIQAANSTIKGLVINRFGGDGVVFFGPGTTGNKVEGNFIGTDTSGTQDLGNSIRGVAIVTGASNNTIGGTVAEARNIISGNDDDGVGITGGTGNRVLSNQISQNTGLGIDLGGGGVTNNDTDDPDTGANNLQNFPVIASATRSSTTGFTTIEGTLNSNPSQNFLIQCFLTDEAAASSHGEGSILLDTTSRATDAGGDTSFQCDSQVPEAGQTVTATATNTVTGDTSEFSENEIVFQP